MSLALSGIGVSRGVAIGKAHIILRGSLEVLESAIPAELIEDEIARFLRAVDTARQQLEDLRGRIPQTTRADIAAFIDTHLLMLDDATLVTTPVDLIRELGCNAEWALKLQRDAVVDVFEQMDDAYLRTRRDDVDHVINRVQRILMDDGGDGDPDVAIPLEGAIVLAYDLTPAETVMLEHQGISAFATECGGPLSHTAILARSMQIPAMVGTHGLQRYIRDGETVILDGLRGVLIAGADERTLDYYRQRQELEYQRQLELARLSDTPAITRDGLSISLMANIELPEDIDAVSRESANGVGLYRTEFLFMNRSTPPNEDEQYDCYVSVIEALKGKPLTIRTLDMGADKQVDGSTRGCSNPALGLRAVRLCLKDHSLFKPQLRAILRASAHGPVRLMVPMLAAALSASDFASHMDFLSIGTNDLIQYTLAIDRVDDEVNYLYDPLHPAVLRLIKMTIDAGTGAGIPVSMCGEMAGDPRYTRLLLGMGLREFSMHHTALQEVKRVINSSTVTSLVPLVQELLDNTTPGRIPGRVDSLNHSTR
jgi:phosphotransferase system enzyme I (PtsI)